MQLHCIDGAEDRDGIALSRPGENGRHALAKSSAKERMLEIGLRLGERADGVAPAHGTLSKPRNLGKDEPHPVAALGAVSKLGQSFVEGFGLGLNEALQLERIGSHRACIARWRPSCF